MNDRDDFAELVGSARNVIKCASLYFNGRIRYGTKGEKVEERLLCMDAIKVYICSVKLPVKIESHFNILSIKAIERVSDSHISIETDEKQTHGLYGLHDKYSLQPFLIILFRNLHAIFPHQFQMIVEFRPENEYDRLTHLSNEYCQDNTNKCRPCGGYSLHYECVCDFHQIPFNRSVQILVDSVFVHRISREFTFREFESIVQKEWLPIIGALRYNEWFKKLTIENIKLSSENIDELCTVIRLCKSIRDLRLINCSLKHDFCTRFSQSLAVSHMENFDLSHNALEDKGLMNLSSSLQRRRFPLISINLQSCSLTHKSLIAFNTALVVNNNLLTTIKILNLSGNHIKEENSITILFNDNQNVLEELHLSDIEFSLELFFRSLATMFCKLRRLFISSVKSSTSPSISGGVKSFFTKNQTLEILQLSNANLSDEFLRELCDGLHSNVYLNKLDLRLSENDLEEFIHEYAGRFASIPSLIALDISDCELENEIPNLLGEFKKNRKLKTLHLGKNFNIKHKNMQKTINALKDLVLDSDLEYLSIADSKLKENASDFLLALTNNTALKVLDVRGNSMGDAGVRVITHILQMNRHLHTIFLDRNGLSLDNFEDIVNAMEENSTIQYLPVPITDIIQMKITEKDRIEKVQILMNKLDSICTKNQQKKDNLPPHDSLIVTTTANLTREMNLSWENHQQLIGDQASLDYVLSCSNRLNNNHNDINSILTRTGHIPKLSTQLHELYIDEEERLKNEWNQICQKFQEKLVEKNERLSRKFYQLFKEQSTINYDDKFQEQIQNYFASSNDNIDQLLHKEIPNRLINYSRQCYMNVATCLQKRAYDTTNDIALDMHRQMETTIFHTKAPQQGSVVTEGTPPSNYDRDVNRNSKVIYRSMQRQNQPQTEVNDEIPSNRLGKQLDGNEYIPNPSPRPIPVANRTIIEKDTRVFTTTQNKGPTPPSPKPLTTDLNKDKSFLTNTNERDSPSIITDAIYGNIQSPQRIKQHEKISENEGDIIEHDLLNIVEEEQQKDIPPELPTKIRSVTMNIFPTIQDNNNNLDVNIEPTIKLVHPGKDRPRRTNVRRPIKRSANDSSSDDGLLTDDNSQGDVLRKSTNEILITPQINESPPTTIAKLIKSTVKPFKTTNDESPSILTKPLQQVPVVEPRPSTMTRSMTLTNHDSPQIINSDVVNESLPRKPSMSTSLYSSLVLPNNNNEQKETNNSMESVSSVGPPVVARTGKATIGGTRVLPVLDPHGDAPPVTLRRVQPDKKPNLAMKSTPIENSTISNIISSAAVDSSALSSSTSNTVNPNEQYIPLTVKQRALLLATTIPAGTSNDKKSTTSSNSISSKTPPYTPRTYRRISEQVNLFC